MNPDIIAEELLQHELERLKELYVLAYNNSSNNVTKLGQEIANVVQALALTLIAKNGGGLFG